MEEPTAVSFVKPHVESPQSVEETAVAAMSPSVPTASDTGEIEKCSITTQQEPHMPNEDGIESDKARTDTDDEEAVEQHKEQHKEEHKEEHKEVMSTSVETMTMVESTTLQEENTEPKTPVGQPMEKDFVEKDVSVAIEEQSEKEVDVQEETIQEKEKQNVAEVVRAVPSPLQSTAVKTVAAEKVEVHGNEVDLMVQDEVDQKVQDEAELMVQNEVELKVQDEVELKVQDEVELKVQDEAEPKVQDEVELNVQNEVELTVQDEAEPNAQDKVETKVMMMEAEEHEVQLVIPSPKRSTPLNLVQHDIDDEESDSEDEEEEAALREAEEEGADLGTPLGYGGGANFDEGQADFASHRFLGPSVATDPSSVRALHSLRRVALHDKPPRFVSEAPVITARSVSLTSSGESSRRNSSSATVTHTSDGLRSQSEAGFVENMLNTYTLTFTESVLGFDTNIVMSLENELMVEVWSVEKDSPAQRGGVVVGDNLISVNGQHIEPHMTKEQVLEMIEVSTIPRTLLFQRDMHDKDPSQSKSLPDKKLVTAKPLMGRLGAAMSQGASLLGSKLKRKKTLVHENSFCDGCGMDPITGALWTCSVCSNYNLCNECYDVGTHGMENTEQMQALNEAIVQYKLQKKCKHFTPEFFLSLRRDICKGRPDKFEYLGEWIANIVVGTSTAKITVRGIEIPSLPPAARQRFVSHLMPLVSNRTDIEVNIEWLPDDADQPSAASRPSVDRMSVGVFGSEEEDEDGADNVPDNLEKLRIWISDKKTRTTSPFA